MVATGVIIYSAEECIRGGTTRVIEEKEQVYEPVGIGSNKCPTSAQRTFYPHVVPASGVFI